MDNNFPPLTFNEKMIQNEKALKEELNYTRFYITMLRRNKFSSFCMQIKNIPKKERTNKQKESSAQIRKILEQ